MYNEYNDINVVVCKATNTGMDCIMPINYKVCQLLDHIYDENTEGDQRVKSVRMFREMLIEEFDVDPYGPHYELDCYWIDGVKHEA